MEQFFGQVEHIISIADVDALSEKINAAGKDFKFGKHFEMFFEVARKKTELIKYIARMMACIRHTHTVIIQNMIESVLKKISSFYCLHYYLDVWTVPLLDHCKRADTQNSSKNLYIFE